MTFNYKFLFYISTAVFIVAIFIIPLHVVRASGTPILDVEVYRWRNNNGTEVTATGAQLENTQITNRVNGDIMRLRLTLDNDGDAIARNQKLTINQGTNSNCSTGQLAIPEAGSCGSWPFCMVDSQLVDGVDTTDWGGISNAPGVFVVGKQVENASNITANFDVDDNPDQFSEIEYSFEVTVNAVSDTNYYFSLTGGDIVDHDVCPSLQTGTITAAEADLSWDTGLADFEIWAGATATTDAVNTWDDGTLICSASLTDDNNRVSTCGSINKNQKYRVQAVLANVNGTAATIAVGDGDFVDHVNVATFWAGTSPTISAVTDCGFEEVSGTDDTGPPTCNVAFSGNNVRITVVTSGTVVVGAATGKEGFMYLITTDSNVSLSDSSSYMNTSIDSITEDSSRVTIGLKRIPGNYIRGEIRIRGKIKFR